MTCLPETIGPIKPTGDKLKGIFYELKTKYVDNPISDNIVSLNGTTSDGNINNVILWNGGWASSLYSDYLEISFPRHYLFPTHYTIKSPSQDWFYPKKWIVYGYNSELDRKDEDKWIKLHEGISSETIFCGTGSRCDKQRINTFPLNIANKQKTSFKFIRFINVEPTENMHFVTAGIDFYGYLSINDYISIKHCKCTKVISNFFLNTHCFFVHIPPDCGIV